MAARGGRVLHVLSQRPMLTGSGVTLDALVREAAAAGWDQHVVCGVPAEDGQPVVGELEASRVRPLTFASAPGAEDGVLPFPVPGMSDVMPYPSTTWSSMDASQLGLYREAWRAHLSDVIASVQPDVIHAHHGWVLTGITKEVAPSVPVVAHTHGTALRQLELCPGLRDEVIESCRGVDSWATLHAGQKDEYARVYGLVPSAVHVVGAGYREALFHSRGAAARTGVAYAGKLSHAKGLCELLDAVEVRDGVHLHVAGDGAGSEADALRERMASMPERVTWHGRLDQNDLAGLLRRCVAFVLPSYFEGLPLVLVEAAACGCRVISTALPGVVDGLSEGLGESLDLVALPPMAGVDTPKAGSKAAYTERLGSAIDRALKAEPLTGIDLQGLTWGAVFQRVQGLWLR